MTIKTGEQVCFLGAEYEVVLSDVGSPLQTKESAARTPHLSVGPSTQTQQQNNTKAKVKLFFSLSLLFNRL